MNKREVVRQLRRDVHEVREGFPEFRGVVVYGSFPVQGSRPNDVDLMLTLERDYIKAGCADEEYHAKIEAARGQLQSNPLYHIKLMPLFLDDPENVPDEFDFYHVKNYLFVGDRATKRIIRDACPFAEEFKI